MAKELLSLSAGNRTLSKSKLKQYAHDMREGRWIEDTFELIKISKEGFLLDGHHRLTSIIKANVSINLSIVRGVDSNIMGVIDTGKSRNSSDALKINGILNSNNVAAIISAILKHELGYSLSMENSKVPSISNVDVIAKYEENPEYWQHLHNKASSIYLKMNKIISPSLIGKYYHLFNEKHPDKVDTFFEELIGGVESNQIITILRSTLIRNKISQKKLSTIVINAYIVKSWNAYVTKQDLKLLKFDVANSEIPAIK
jgi:hypothetical protein